MAAVDVLEAELIAAAEAGTGEVDADAARLAINEKTAAAIAKYVKTVVETGGVVNTTVSTPDTFNGTGVGGLTLGT